MCSRVIDRPRLFRALRKPGKMSTRRNTGRSVGLVLGVLLFGRAAWDRNWLVLLDGVDEAVERGVACPFPVQSVSDPLCLNYRIQRPRRS